MKSHQLIKKEGYSNDYIFRVVERDMRNMSEDDFVAMMRDLLNDVADEYRSMCIEAFNERIPELIDRHHRDLMRQYSKKLDAYKRESSRTKLLSKIDEQVKERVEQCRKYLSTDIFWDIMPMCFDNAHPVYTIVTSKSSDNELRLNYKNSRNISKCHRVSYSNMKQQLMKQLINRDMHSDHGLNLSFLMM